MFSQNAFKSERVKIAWDLGDTLVRIRKKSLQEGAVATSVILGFLISKDRIEKEIKAEWSLRKDDYHLSVIRQVDTIQKEYDYWVRDFYTNLFRRVSGRKTIPLALLEFFCSVQMNPKNFELFPEAIPVMNNLQKIGIEQALVSNSFPSAIDIIKSFKIDKYMKFGILSHECKLSKPDPKIYRLIVEKFDLRREEYIFYIDDRKEFLNIPTDLRIRPVLFDDSRSQTTWCNLRVNRHKELLEWFTSQPTTVFSNWQPIVQTSMFL